MARLLLLSLASLASCVVAGPLISRQSAGTATVDLGTMRGQPQHYASGFLYGIPDTPNQIPSHFYSDIAFNYGRAGGAQLPAEGYMAGVDQYRVSPML